MNVFLLAPDLARTGDGAAAWVLARGLPKDRFHVVVGVLGPAVGAAADELRAVGVAVESVPIRHVFDLNGVRRFRRVVREANPAVIHAFGPAAARASRLLVSSNGDSGNAPRLVVSGVTFPGNGLGGWLAARQLRRADRVVPETWADGERYRRLGVRGDRLTRIGPAAPDPAPEPDREGVFRSLNIPTGSRLVVGSGTADRGIGPKDAVVVFDMLRYEARDLHLAVFGAGAAAAGLEQFGRALAFDDFRICFAPPGLNRAAVARLAEVVWVTAPHGGIDEALEAMAAGKPVVGWQTPELAEVVDDGITGFLVPVGDRAAFAAKVRILLEDPARAATLGEAGRSRATERFTAARMVEQFGRLYGELASA